jgi:translation initiation factor IF-1
VTVRDGENVDVLEAVTETLRVDEADAVGEFELDEDDDSEIVEVGDDVGVRVGVRDGDAVKVNVEPGQPKNTGIVYD